MIKRLIKKFKITIFKCVCVVWNSEKELRPNFNQIRLKWMIFKFSKKIDTSCHNQFIRENKVRRTNCIVQFLIRIIKKKAFSSYISIIWREIYHLNVLN